MTVNRKAQLAEVVAERWKSQYFDARDHRWHDPVLGSAKYIYQQLVAAKGDIQKIEAAFGGNKNHESWIVAMCCECKEYKDPTVEFGNDSESWATLCVDCMKAAIEKATA